MRRRAVVWTTSRSTHPTVAVLSIVVVGVLLFTGVPQTERSTDSSLNYVANLASANSLPRTDAAHQLGRAPTTPSFTLSGASTGKVVETAYVNYNASTVGNFPSSVYDWAAGTAVVDPVTDQLWIPEWPVTVGSIAPPESAPALVYDPVGNDTQMVKNLTNTSAFAFDPLNGDLYATDPIDNAVLVFSLTTHNMAHAPIPVGDSPLAIVYDPDTQNLFVANDGSGNITVINGSTNHIISPGISVGAGPVALADDVRNGTLFIADSGAASISVVNTSGLSVGIPIPLLVGPTSLAYSRSTNLLAVGLPGSTHLNIYDAGNQAITTVVSVGRNISSIVSDSNGTEFVLANGTGDNLTVVNGAGGTVFPDHPPTSENPARLSLDPTNGLLYAWSGLNRTITTVNITSGAETQLAPDLAARAGPIAYDPESGRAFVADWMDDSVSVLNATTFSSAQPPIRFPTAPTSLVDDAATGTIYVGYIGGVAAVDAMTGSITSRNATLAGNNTQLVLNEMSGLLWDMNKQVGLEALSLPGLKVVTAVGIGAGTANVRGAVLDPATNELFVINLTSSLIAVVNGSTGHVIDSGIPGIPPVLSLAYDSADQEIYAVGHSLWVIDPSTNGVVAGPIPIAPHVVAWSIVYDPSREFLYVTSNDALSAPWPGNLTVIDGSSVVASEGAYATIPTGQLPLDLQPVTLAGSSSAGSSEIWVTNFFSGTVSVIASSPAITFFAATPNPVDVGVQSTVLLGFAGGAGPSHVSYTGLPTGCSSTDSRMLNCTPEEKGAYLLNATVVDSLGASASASTLLSVSPVIGLQISLGGGAPSGVDLGTSVDGTALAVGGTGPYNYTWSWGDASSTWGSTTAHLFANAGSYLVVVTVRDSGGGAVANTSVVVIQPLPTATARAYPSNVTDVNVGLTFIGGVEGGTQPGNYSWTFGDGNSSLGSLVTHKYSRSGIYYARLDYRDASGQTRNQTLNIEVNPDPAATISVTPANSPIRPGTILAFTAQISGGTGPYFVDWNFDDGSYAYGVATNHSYGTTGTFDVSLYVQDNVLAFTNLTYRVVVTSGTGSAGLGAGFNNGILLGLVLGATAAAVILFATARAKKQRPSPPSAYVPPEAAEEGRPWRES